MKVLLLDAYNLIFRAKSGFTAGDYPVIYNFFRGLRSLIEKFEPEKVYFVLEGNPTFRKNISEGAYKGNRPEQSRSFHEQKANIIALVKSSLPFITIKHPELECDDTIATYASMHARKGDDVTIISSDSDFTQLLNTFEENFRIYNPVKKSFVEKPDFDYVTWKALRGDPTDNIAGIPGVGDKTAEKLCKNSKLLCERLESKDVREVFENNVNLIRLVDFSNNLDKVEVHVGKFDEATLRMAFEKMSFTSMTKDNAWKKYCDTFNNIRS